MIEITDDHVRFDNEMYVNVNVCLIKILVYENMSVTFVLTLFSGFAATTRNSFQSCQLLENNSGFAPDKKILISLR